MRISTAENDCSDRVTWVAGAIPGVVVGADFQRRDARPRHAVVPEDGRLLDREQRVAARLRGAHHGDARILVGLERIQRIDDEGEFHGGGAKSTPMLPQTAAPRRRCSPPAVDQATASASTDARVPASVASYPGKAPARRANAGLRSHCSKVAMPGVRSCDVRTAR